MARFSLVRITLILMKGLLRWAEVDTILIDGHGMWPYCEAEAILNPFVLS